MLLFNPPTLSVCFTLLQFCHDHFVPFLLFKSLKIRIRRKQRNKLIYPQINSVHCTSFLFSFINRFSHKNTQEFKLSLETFVPFIFIFVFFKVIFMPSSAVKSLQCSTTWFLDLTFDFNSMPLPKKFHCFFLQSNFIANTQHMFLKRSDFDDFVFIIRCDVFIFISHRDIFIFDADTKQNNNSRLFPLK